MFVGNLVTPKSSFTPSYSKAPTVVASFLPQLLLFPENSAYFTAMMPSYRLLERPARSQASCRPCPPKIRRRCVSAAAAAVFSRSSLMNLHDVLYNVRRTWYPGACVSR
ncbi:uncharacterized protein PHALS_03561 [Plasmopara halstedii]|uniref:Uncharacterized protein n=1 Tax=Plasmopara halstedii TaxID=4781 RepID=A0A0P1B092_PLAHL|nr:uncharacterized protein PHALS_03561 [Plasmopara halstedii]CEG46887.1 hypothetical protein PHALS_03561 [Plasmopara halstedii]|eukprot:XP_024583256.1 hypothetical protein PHALS_03561 [Plasmopara halstedii]